MTAFNVDGTHQQTEIDELALIEHMAVAHDAEGAAELSQAIGAGEPQLALAVQQDPAQDCTLIFTVARDFLVPLYPSLAKVYSDETIAQLSQAAAPVMLKYNVTSGGLFSQFVPEIMLAVVAGPVVLKTIEAVKFDNAQREAANDAEKGGKVINGGN